LVVQVHFKQKYEQAWHFNRRPFVLCLFCPPPDWSQECFYLAKWQEVAMLSFAWTANPDWNQTCTVLDPRLVEVLHERVEDVCLQIQARRPCGNMRGNRKLSVGAAVLDSQQRDNPQDLELRSMDDPVPDFRLSAVNAGQPFTKGSIAMYIGKRASKNKRKLVKKYCEATKQWFKAGLQSPR
jgi:hypothetical protein